MIGKLFKAVAYTKAPKAVFALLHPRSALKLGMFLWLVKKLIGPADRGRRVSPLSPSGGV